MRGDARPERTIQRRPPEGAALFMEPVGSAVVGLAAQLMGAMGARRFFFNGDSHLQVAALHISQGESVTVIDGQFHDCHGLFVCHSFWIYTVILTAISYSCRPCQISPRRAHHLQAAPIVSRGWTGFESLPCDSPAAADPDGWFEHGWHSDIPGPSEVLLAGTYFRNDITENFRISICFGPGQHTAPARRPVSLGSNRCCT